MIITFRVIGEPVGQPRPKAQLIKRGPKPFIHMYTPSTADGWKRLIEAAALPHRPRTPIEGPVRVDIDFIFPRPQRLLRRNSPDGEVLHTVKPDRDNTEKVALDALSRVGFWKDDCQVCAGEIRKFYASRRGTPGARVTIQTIETTEV